MTVISCKFCLKDVEVTVWGDHIAKDEHLSKVPSKLQIKGTFTNSQITEIESYFNKFGLIKQCLFRNPSGIDLEFVDVTIHSLIAHKEHNINGKRLNISWGESDKLEQKNEDSDEGQLPISDDEANQVPSDFFDAFSDDDFLSGLKIIDELQQEAKKNEKKKKKQSGSTTRRKTKSRSKSPKSRSRVRARSRTRKTRSKSPRVTSRSPRGRSRSRERRRRSWTPKRRRRSRSRSRNRRRSRTPKKVEKNLDKERSKEKTKVKPIEKVGTVEGLELATQHYQEKKITLLDYLSIKHKSNKPTDPAHFQQKTEILTLCHHALLFFNESCFSVKSRFQAPPTHRQHPSPLRNTKKILFTSPKAQTFSDKLLNFLKYIGFVKKEVSVSALIQEVADSLSGGAVVDKEMATLILQVSLMGLDKPQDVKKVSVGTQS